MIIKKGGKAGEGKNPPEKGRIDPFTVIIAGEGDMSRGNVMTDKMVDRICLCLWVVIVVCVVCLLVCAIPLITREAKGLGVSVSQGYIIK